MLSFKEFIKESRTVIYTDKEWKNLSSEKKLSFGAGNVKRVTKKTRDGRMVNRWEVYKDND